MSYQRTTRNRCTGTKITVGRADVLDVDTDGGPWVTICEDHGSICTHATLALARSHATAPEWCEDCNELLYPSPQPTVCPACGGEALPLGTLGQRVHYRCRQCGIDCSTEAA